MNSPMPSHSSLWQAYLHNCRSLVAMAEPTMTAGRITRVAGLVMEAVGLKLPVGSPCNIPLPNGTMIEAEVVGFQDDRLFLMPQSDVEGIVPGTRVYPVEPVRPPPRTGPISFTPRRADEHSRRLPVGEELLGRVLDGAGRPLDNLGPLHTERSAPLAVRAANPLGRAPIRDILDTGIRAINSMLTVGRGQRMGLFAGSGVGKSVLLGMPARPMAASRSRTAPRTRTRIATTPPPRPRQNCWPWWPTLPRTPSNR